MVFSPTLKRAKPVALFTVIFLSFGFYSLLPAFHFHPESYTDHHAESEGIYGIGIQDGDHSCSVCAYLSHLHLIPQHIYDRVELGKISNLSIPFNDQCISVPFFPTIEARASPPVLI